MTATKTTTEPKRVLPSFEQCEQCGAPLDHQQRYCVSCAERRPDPNNPTTRYFATASRRAKLAAAPRRPVQTGSSLKAAAVLVLLLLPVAVVGGILVGRSDDDGSSADLAAAIRDGGGLASADSSSGEDTTLASDTGGGAITSDFSLQKGYTVQLTTIPSSSDQDAVDKATDDAESKGAKDVGVIVPADYAITPDPGGDLVIYSGEFDQKPDAEKALKELGKDFPDAKVVAVKAAAGNGGGNEDPKDGAGGELVEKTDYGDVHKVTDIEPTDADQEEGEQIAQDQANQTGGDYIDSQQGLPDVIAVGEP
ncbi:MAG: hypothetical protein U0R24_02020 [Solirubrobacterales bacterium]